MSGTPGDQGNNLHNMQNFSYDDGNRRMQYSQYGWSSAQQGTPTQAPMPMSPQPQPQMQQQIMPQMQPGLDMAAQHMNMHNASMQSAM